MTTTPTFHRDKHGTLRATVHGVSVWVAKRGRIFAYGTGAGASSRERGQTPSLDAAMEGAAAAIKSQS